MEDHIRRKLDKFERQNVFMLENAADFPVGSPGHAAALVNRNLVAEINALAAEQVSGDNAARQAFDNKEEDLDELWLLMRNLNRAANAFADEEPGSDEKFRLPRNRSEKNILAAARAFYADSEPFAEKFVEYGLDAGFRAALQSRLTRIAQNDQSADNGAGQRAGATGALLDAARRGTDNSRRLDAIVRIKYAADPQKLAAWTVAAHLARAPQAKAPATEEK